MAETEQLGVAVQGAGNVATEHLKAYLRNPNCRVVAIGSRTKEGAAAKARQVGLDPDQIGLYDDFDALLAHPGLAALSICTPHTRHAQEIVGEVRHLCTHAHHLPATPGHPPVAPQGGHDD